MAFPPIHFLLNGEPEAATASPGMLALDYLRQRKGLCGSKEGCKEGDCGACTVIVVDLQCESIRYRPVTSCLLPLADLEGRHLVTIEGLNMARLSPIQAAMVDAGGTQCGYCTPGFIVAMTAWLLDETKPLTLEGLKYAISGNLCRCTGYRPIKDAGVAVADRLAAELTPGERIAQLCAHEVIPPSFATAPARLAALRADLAPAVEEPSAPDVIVAGGTDLYVQRGEELPARRIRFLNHGYTPVPVASIGGRLRIDARMSFEDFADDPLVRAALPAIGGYNQLIASWPVRTRPTLGGNIGNASPIADMTCLLLALDAELTLRDGDAARTLPLDEFFLGYKQTARGPTEWIEWITIPAPGPQTRIHWEKVSKRAWLDIATVNAAIRLELADGCIQSARLALGGVAAIPLFLPQASAFLAGKVLSLETVTAMLAVADGEFTPISDVRGSADYKRLLARQLTMAHFVTLFPEIFSAEAVCAALR